MIKRKAFQSAVRRMAATLLLLVLAGTCPTVTADSIHSQRDKSEASMLVRGHIVVTPTGTVSSYTIDEAAGLPAPVMQSITRSVPRFRFEPVRKNGQPVAAHASMSLRLVARRLPDSASNFELSIRSAYFGEEAERAGIAKPGQRKPRYPDRAIRARVGGTVYLVMKIDRSGRVEQIAAEQVNLNVVGREGEMRRWREMLAEASIEAAKDWTFVPEDPPSGSDGRVVRTAMTFELQKLGEKNVSPFNHWRVSVPGPRAAVEWLSPNQRAVGSPDAIADGQVASATPSLSLQTALDPG